MRTTQIVPFSTDHVAAAAVIAGARTAALRATVPAVDVRWTEPAPWLPIATNVAARGLGVSAVNVETGAVIGVLAGWPIRTGEPRLYCSEATAGVMPGLPDREARRIGEALVEGAMDAWVAAGIRMQVIACPPSDPAFRDLLTWLGFGAVGVDALATTAALRTSTAAGGLPPGIRIRRAGPDDLPAVLALEAGLRAHLAAAPVCLVMPHPIDPAEHADVLVDPAFAVLLAEDAGGAPAALIRIGPTADDVAQVVHAPATLSISRAFTIPALRGTGIAAALLAAATAWAEGEGASRIGVDFESGNILASRFWLAHFAPVSVGYARRLHRMAGTPEANPA